MTRLREPTEPRAENPRTLRVLSLEASLSDGSPVHAYMTEGGIDCEMIPVQTRAEFFAALEQGNVDLILAGYPVPTIDDVSALEFAREYCPHVPFIVVSGEAGEEIAIETLKSGATDYVLEDRLERLLPAVRRAIRESGEQRGERGRAEAEVRRSEAQFRTLIEQIPAVTYTQHIAEPGKSETKPTLYASPQIEAQLGYPPQAFLENPELWIKLIHPEDRDRVLAEDARTDETGQPFKVEYRLLTKDGRVAWVLDEAVLVRDEDGRPLYWQGVQYDVTRQKRVEEELREEEMRFKATFEQAAVGIAHVALDGGWLRVNQKLCEIVGYSREELLQKTFQDITHRDDLEASETRLRRLRSGEIETFSTEKRYVRKDGSMIWGNLTVSLAREPSGGPGYFIAVIEDITERKATEQALRESEETFRLLSDNAHDVIYRYRLKPSPGFEYVSPSVTAVSGYSPAEFYADPMLGTKIVHPEDAHLLDELTHLARSTMVRWLRKDGAVVWTEQNNKPVYDESGELVAIEGIARDVTERVLAEQNLRRSLTVLLALREAGQVLGSTLSSEEIISRLLEIMRSVSGSTAALISTRGQDGELRVWRAAGLDGLRRRTRFAREAQAARQATLAEEKPHLFRLKDSASADGSLVGLCLPLRIRDHVTGMLEAYGGESLADSDTVDILSSLANQAASALENARLYEDLEERERMLQDLVEKLLRAQEEEHRRIAYEVHDGLAQVAVAAHQRLQTFAHRHSPRSDRGRKDLERILGLVWTTVSDARQIIANLRPTTLDDLGLASTLALEVERLRDNGYEVDYEDGLGDERLPEAVEIALFRVSQEALTNVRKHAEARSLRIRLTRGSDEIHLEIRDYGRGFDPEQASAGTGPGERVGIAGMHERVAMLGGELTIRSEPDAGTSVLARIPLDAAS